MGRSVVVKPTAKIGQLSVVPTPSVLPKVGVHGASTPSAQKALNTKIRALENAEKKAVKIKRLPDGRIRYYEAEKPAKTQGITRGASYVTEYNRRTGQVKSWMESYDQSGKVNRVHPKMIDGQDIIGQHYPATKVELESWAQKLGGSK